MQNLTGVFLDSYKTLTEKLLECISAYDIFCEFIGYDLKINEVVLSPIRNDKRPTFILFVPDHADDVYFKDFAWVGGDVFKFVKLFAVYQEGINLKTRYDIIHYIDSKIGVGLFNDKKCIIRRKMPDKSFFAAKRKIKFKSRKFTSRDIEYWTQYHITVETLNRFNVRSVHKLLNEINEVKFTVSQTTLTFAYVIFNKVKLYSPEEVDFKWRNTCPGHYLQGLEQLKKFPTKNEDLIITKSLKDAMVFFTFLGDKYDNLAPHTEGYIFTDKFLASLYVRYKRIIIIYDFDLAGVRGANALRKRNKSKFFVIFVSTKRIRVNKKITIIDKDISDYSVGRNPEQINKHLKSIGL